MRCTYWRGSLLYSWNKNRYSPRTNTRKRQPFTQRYERSCSYFSFGCLAATFDRGLLDSQSRLLTFSPSLLLSVFFFFLVSHSVYNALDILSRIPCVYILSCQQHYALTHIHTNNYIYALLRTNTTTDKGVIFCAIFLFFTLRALLSSETNFSKPSNNQN